MKLFVTFAIMALTLRGSVASPVEASSTKDMLAKFESDDYPQGDARWCIDRARKTNFSLGRFEVLPGVGWDNLRNLEAGMVVMHDFSECKVTDDGTLLIPDNVFTIPIKSSRVDSFAEVIDSWLNTSSATSHTVNVQAGLNAGLYAASGSFSFEHAHLKSKQVEGKSVTVRVQLRYKRYEAKLQPDPVLTPSFKSRLLEMAAHIELNNTDQARYEAQLLVRDFGTHYLTSVTAGAALVKEDYIKKSYIGSSDETKTGVTAAASGRFLTEIGRVSASASYQYAHSSVTKESYDQNTTASHMTTHGGPLMPASPSTQQWIQGMDKNLVALDRAGEPLYFLITTHNFPELTIDLVADLEKIVRSSVELYYEMNTVKGCTKEGAPNFSFSANFDDGSCDKKATNMTFGGVYQTCSVSGDFIKNNPCSGLETKNPLTGDFSCPSSYRAVELQTGTHRLAPESRQHNCRRCGFLWRKTCCETEQLQATGTYTSYWCAATGPVPQDSGYLFGGLYTNQHDNPVIQAKGCPQGYYAQNILTDLRVCISDDFELSAGLAVPFGGFFSCHQGNPLASGPVNGALKQAGGRPSLKMFMVQQQEMTRKCPEGYSQHVAAVTTSGCAVHYCVQSGALSGPLTAPVKRPPFTDPPAVPAMPDKLVMIDLSSQTWLKNQKARQYLEMTKIGKAASPVDVKQWINDEDARQYQMALMSHMGKTISTGDSDGASGLSSGTVAGLSVGVTLSCVAIATIVLMLIKKRRTRQQRCHSRLVDEPFQTLNTTSYGTSDPGSSHVTTPVVVST